MKSKRNTTRVNAQKETPAAAVAEERAAAAPPRGTYARAMAEAKTMDPQEMAATLRLLAMDPRFAAVLAFLWMRRESYVKSASAQKFATHHGVLAHGMGSVNALDDTIEATRAFYAVARVTGGMQKPQED
jgi:hypothetical protein